MWQRYFALVYYNIDNLLIWQRYYGRRNVCCNSLQGNLEIALASRCALVAHVLLRVAITLYQTIAKPF